MEIIHDDLETVLGLLAACVAIVVGLLSASMAALYVHEFIAHIRRRDRQLRPERAPAEA